LASARRDRRLLHTATLAAAALLCLASCETLLDNAETKLQGKAAPLKEADLPNCSRILTCCANLSAGKATGPLVQESCAKINTPADTGIGKYQSAKIAIQADTSLNDEAKAKATAELRSKTVGTLEPGCRCLLEETLGKVSLDGFLTPADCETVTATGALPEGKKCSDVTDAVINAKR